MPSLAPPPLLLLLLLALAALRARATLPDARAAPSHVPLLMLSTMDGTVTAFDARSGDTLFTHHDPRPAVDSWAAPGMPEYVPSLDGLLYRIDRATEEAHIIDGKFISTRHAAPDPGALPAADAPPPREPDADAVILTKEDSSVLYFDLRSGRVLRELTFAESPPQDPLLPRPSDHILVVSRTSVGVRVLHAVTGQELANATLVHTAPSFLDRGRCLTPPDPADDAYVAYLSAARDRVIVRNLAGGEVLWSKDIATPVVEAHGLAGVKIANSRRDADAISRGETRSDPVPLGLPNPANPAADAPSDVIVSKEGKYVYAMLAGPDGAKEHLYDDDDEYDDDDAHNYRGRATPRRRPPRRHRKPALRYRISGGRDPRALSSFDRVLVRGRLPIRSSDNQEAPPPEDVSAPTSRDVGLALFALIVVGYVGYIVGRRPRVRDRRSRGRRVRKKPRSSNAIADDDDEARVRAKELGGSDTDVDDGDGGNDEDGDAQEDAIVERHWERRKGSSSKGSGEPSSDADGEAPVLRLSADAQMESSTGSTGSGSQGGFVSNRTQSGWMTVGCLHVSSKVLGVGSHGTVVYEGKMMPGERKVAVKRLLRQFFESARKEISLLVELDEASPHVVRYFAMEEDSEFIYLALELCAGSLAERVSERQGPVPPITYKGGPPPIYTSRALRQLLQGLSDLHRVGVVHRDVKPQNVLITRTTSGQGDVKLADVGLALRLAANRSSYTAVTNAGGGVGTTGWRAPEVLSGGRQTKAVDIFAAGCVVCYVLTGGNHPFGNAIFGRDGNIAAGNPSLEALEALQLPEATDIVTKMIDPVTSQRPSADEALRHPFFWTDAMKLSFLVDISDRLYDTRHDPARYTENLDRYHMAREHCGDWLVLMDMQLLMGLGRGYDNTASGLLRVIRNKRNHYSELPSSVQSLLGPLPEDKNRSDSGADSSHDSEDNGNIGSNFLTYFTSKVPHLLMCVYLYAIENPVLIDQPHFQRYGLKPLGVREHLPLHPLVRKKRAPRAEAATPSRLVEIDERTDGFVLENDSEQRRSVDEEDEPGKDDADEIVDEEEVVVTMKTNRRAYHRHELVALQAMCPTGDSEISRRLIGFGLYQPTAYTRYRKRLGTNMFEDSDFEQPADQEGAAGHGDVPPGFQRVQRRHPPQGPPGFGPRTDHHTPGSSTSRPPGFGGGPPGFGGPSGFGGPPGNTGHSGTGGNGSQYPRRNSTPAIAPTVSQFSGEERIVDFGALRRRR